MGIAGCNTWNTAPLTKCDEEDVSDCLFVSFFAVNSNQKVALKKSNLQQKGPDND